MKILALDLGTSTGWATDILGAVESGTWKLATPREIKTWGQQRITRRRDPRVSRLADKLAPFCGAVDCVVFEDVNFSSYTFQVQLWSSLRSALWLFCDGSPLIEAIPVGTLKKFATGNGSADKAGMEHALKREHPSLWRDGIGDDEVDAVWLFLWAQQNLCRAKLN